MSYQIDWDNATNQFNWTTLVGYKSAYLATTWTQNGTKPGNTYSFRMAAKNSQGWYEWSPITFIQAVYVPAQTHTPVVKERISSSTNVVIQWQAPD